MYPLIEAVLDLLKHFPQAENAPQTKDSSSKKKRASKRSGRRQTKTPSRPGIDSEVDMGEGGKNVIRVEVIQREEATKGLAVAEEYLRNVDPSHWTHEIVLLFCSSFLDEITDCLEADGSLSASSCLRLIHKLVDQQQQPDHE